MYVQHHRRKSRCTTSLPPLPASRYKVRLTSSESQVRFQALSVLKCEGIEAMFTKTFRRCTPQKSRLLTLFVFLQCGLTFFGSFSRAQDAASSESAGQDLSSYVEVDAPETDAGTVSNYRSDVDARLQRAPSRSHSYLRRSFPAFGYQAARLIPSFGALSRLTRPLFPLHLLPTSLRITRLLPLLI